MYILSCLSLEKFVFFFKLKFNVIVMNDEKNVFIFLYVCNSFSFCKIWYLKKKYNGREVGVEYIGFNMNGFDFLNLLKRGIINFGFMELVCKSFYVREYFLSFLLFVLVFDLGC